MVEQSNPMSASAVESSTQCGCSKCTESGGEDSLQWRMSTISCNDSNSRVYVKGKHLLIRRTARLVSFFD